MSTVKSTVMPKTKHSLVQWVSSRWIEHFVFVYGLWMSFLLFGTILMRIGWNSVGEVIFIIASIFTIPLHVMIFFLLVNE